MTTPPSFETLLAPMEICWQFDYAIDIEKLRKLYAKAEGSPVGRREAISTGTRPIDPSKPIVDEARYGFDALPADPAAVEERSARPSRPTPPRTCSRSSCTASRAR